MGGRVDLPGTLVLEVIKWSIHCDGYIMGFWERKVLSVYMSRWEWKSTNCSLFLDY